VKLQQTLKYAIGAILELSQCSEGETVSCTVIAANRNIPKRFLLQILRKLVAAGVLRSARGADGGYALNRASEEISLFDIIQVLESPLDESDEFFADFAPEIRHLLLSTIRTSITAQGSALNRLTLAQLAQAESRTSRKRDPRNQMKRRDGPASPLSVKNGRSALDRDVTPPSSTASRT
jgi:Rrf2 family protein